MFFGLTGRQMIGVALGAAAIHFYRNGFQEIHALDIAAMATIAAMLWWFSRRRFGNAPGGEDSRETFAFRLGKSLNRVFRHRNL